MRRNKKVTGRTLDWVLVAGLLLGAALLRAVYAWRMVVRYGIEQFSDFHYMEGLAQSLAAGKGFTLQGARIYNQSIGYPFFLSLVYRVFGATPYVMIGFNVVLGALSVALVYLLGRRLVWCGVRNDQGRAIAVCGAALALLYPDSLLYCVFAASENLLIPVLLLLLLMSLVSNWEYRLLQGGMVGMLAALAASVKAYALLICLIIPIYWWFRDRRYMARTIAAAVVGLLCLAPWTYLNYVASEGRFVPFAAIAGAVVLDGTNPEATGRPTNHYNLSPEEEAVLHPVDLDRARLRKAIGYIRESPRWFAKLCAQKVMWGLIPARDYVFEVFGQVRMFTPFLSRWGTTAFNTVVLLGSMLGILYSKGHRPTFVFGLGLFLVPVLTQVMFCALPRYRFPFWFCLTPYVAYATIRLGASLLSLQWFSSCLPRFRRQRSG
jgi:hypothetical protein